MDLVPGGRLHLGGCGVDKLDVLVRVCVGNLCRFDFATLG
jgi:hypothetical protein